MPDAGLLIALVALATVNVLLLRWLGPVGGLVRPVATDQLAKVRIPSPRPLDCTSSLGQQVLAIDREAGELDQALQGLRLLMDQVGGVDRPLRPHADPNTMLRDLAKGRGALCSHMALLYRHVLSTLEIESRPIQIQRNIFEPFDVHALVEARIQGNWVLLDPTFHLLFRNSQGDLLNAQQIKDAIYHGRIDQISLEFLGEVRYPVRADRYYVDLLALFTHVFVRQPVSQLGRLLPPWRYLLGPRLYYCPAKHESIQPLRTWHKLYTLTVLYLPLACIGLVLAIASSFLA